jgi:quinohemoprotein ethanol dehydrogenase
VNSFLPLVLAPFIAVTSTLAWAADRPADESTHLRDSSDGRDWAAYGRTYGEQHYSPLGEINTRNVATLGLIWSLDLPAGNTVTQPLEINGVLYFTVGNSVVHAVDALTGHPLWVFDPRANEAAGVRLRTSWGSRGIAYWNGKVYTGTVDGRLIAIDAATGQEVWSQQTLPRSSLGYITGAPRTFDGKVIVGQGGADSSDLRGFVTAYDAESGKQLWRFFTVPGNPADGFEDSVQAMAAKTWSGEWWKYGGGGNVWNAFTYDAETNTILLGTGNGAPWNRRVRSAGKGDNLFLACVVALDASSGKYKWHYQVNPGEMWDYSASMDMHLAELTINGSVRRVLVTAPKNGFVYVIDRTDGTLISAEKITKVTWATKIDLVTGRPVETPESRYPNGQTLTLWPGTSGAHTNLPSAFSPLTGFIYIPVVHYSVSMNDAGINPSTWKRQPGGQEDFAVNVDFAPKSGQLPTSELLAWNPATQTPVWHVPTPMMWNGGLMATGGNLVFQGQVDGRFSAYDSRNGNLLWSFASQGAVLAPPISYLAGGRQYISVLTGMGLGGAVVANGLPARFNYRTQARRVLTFAVGGEATLPASQPYRVIPISDTTYTPDPTAASRGAAIFNGRCLLCHGVNADAGGGLAPDLRTSPVPQSLAAFDTVVRHGALVSHGMPVFGELTDVELRDLDQFLRSRSAELREP